MNVPAGGIGGWVDAMVAPHYAWVQEEILPTVYEIWYQMDVPSWDVYSMAVQTWARDVAHGSQSTARLVYLTMKPIVVLVWIFLQFLGGILKILFHHLLEKGWISVQKGALQAKAGMIWFYHFQRNLSRNELLGELAICLLLVLAYYLRKWLKRQTYWARFTKWYKMKKRRLIQVSRISFGTKSFWNICERVV